nr:linoleate 10r-lipoxygenase [Quercus suber]
MALLERMFSRRRKSRQINGDSNGHSSGAKNGAPSDTVKEEEIGSAKELSQVTANGSSDGAGTNGYKPSAAVNGEASMKSPDEAQGRYPDPPNHGESRQDVGAALESFMGLVSHMMRPLPEKNGDGTYVAPEAKHASLLEELGALGFKDYKTLVDYVSVGHNAVDDKTMLMEPLLEADRRPSQITTSCVRAESFHSSKRPGALPDPGLIFDSLFAREKFEPHPNNNSSIIFYWASLIIHDCFQTDHDDFNNSKTSSYLDLSTLYGDTQDDQNMIRTFKDGKLKPDCFAEDRLLLFPPVCILWRCENLPLINENGRFTRPRDGLPEEAAAKAWKKYDEDIFQTARLVTCGLYVCLPP